MAIHRLYSESDTWITNVRLNEFTTVRASGSNLGSDPSLNIFARKGDVTSASLELAHTLIKFPVSQLSQSIFADLTIPSSSVEYRLHLFEMAHDDSVPVSFALDVYPLSRSWSEGVGIDSENFSDVGFANWEMATENVSWTITGSDFLSTMSSSQHFETGRGSLEVDITEIVNEWLTGSLSNYGLLLKLSDTDENNGVNKYRKAFHGRETKFVDRLPYIEARWDSVTKDQRHNFAYDIENTLILQNYIRGEPTTLASPVTVTVRNPLTGTATYSKTFSAAETSPGAFTASVYISSTGSYSGSKFYDIWSANGVTKVTGSFQPLLLSGALENVDEQLVINVNNLKRVYSEDEEVRFVVNVRPRDFVTHRGIISTSSLEIENKCIEKMYYEIINDETGAQVVSYGTGSKAHTQLSYNKTGNYFDFGMKVLIPGFKYRLNFLIDENNEKQIIDDDFVFKVK